MSTAELQQRVDLAKVGVLGHVTSKGMPNALAVTPYVVDGRLVVTSTLALIDKATSIRADPRVTLTAGGTSVSGTASVQVDQSPAFFDRHLRERELAKYPPSRSLLALPFHRQLFGWYVGRVVIWIEPDSVREQPVGDHATVTVLGTDGRLRTWNVPVPSDPSAVTLTLPDEVADGPALVLIHEEDPDMRNLRQLRLRGVAKGGMLDVTQRRGTLVPSRVGTIDELKTLRSMARRARANRDVVANWPRIAPPRDD